MSRLASIYNTNVVYCAPQEGYANDSAGTNNGTGAVRFLHILTKDAEPSPPTIPLTGTRTRLSAGV